MVSLATPSFGGFSEFRQPGEYGRGAGTIGLAGSNPARCH